MGIHETLPRGMQDHIDHSLRNLERFAGPVSDTMETLRRLAPPLLIGLEQDVMALETTIARIKDRWEYYKSRGEWASTTEVNAHLDKLPQASAPREDTPALDTGLGR